MTRSAIAAIERLGGRILVDLDQGGCCGTFYSFSIPAADVAATRYGCAGAWLLVTEPADAIMAGATLDFGARLKPPRFRVLNNPNTPERCPCRRSFGRPWPGPRQPACRSYLPMPWDEHAGPPPAQHRRPG